MSETDIGMSQKTFLFCTDEKKKAEAPAPKRIFDVKYSTWANWNILSPATRLTFKRTERVD